MTSERYNARDAEPRWQRQWDEQAIFVSKNDDSRPKYYVLEMFPYPSGRIHIGHVRNYTLGDVLARYMRARGYNVLHPMGWDAFGLPAENAAIERKVHPAKWTYENIDTMRAQLKANWDPAEKTVLANEQVIDGRGWRSGAVVEQRDLTQWFFKITAYAEELLGALDGFTGKWPDFVRKVQRDWIGKSSGASMTFDLCGGKLPKKLATLEIFTT